MKKKIKVWLLSISLMVLILIVAISAIYFYNNSLKKIITPEKVECETNYKAGDILWVDGGGWAARCEYISQDLSNCKVKVRCQSWNSYEPFEVEESATRYY